MAQTIAIDQSHRTSPKHAHVGVVAMSNTITDAYATASGGVSINISNELTLLAIAHADVLAIVPMGNTASGHLPSFTKTATNGVFTMRLYAGTAEIADGALTQTARFLVLYNQGAPN